MRARQVIPIFVVREGAMIEEYPIQSTISPSGAKALVIFAGIPYGLKPVPFN